MIHVAEGGVGRAGRGAGLFIVGEVSGLRV